MSYLVLFAMYQIASKLTWSDGFRRHHNDLNLDFPAPLPPAGRIRKYCPVKIHRRAHLLNHELKQY